MRLGLRSLHFWWILSLYQLNVHGTNPFIATTPTNRLSQAYSGLRFSTQYRKCMSIGGLAINSVRNGNVIEPCPQRWTQRILGISINSALNSEHFSLVLHLDDVKLLPPTKATVDVVSLRFIGVPWSLVSINFVTEFHEICATYRLKSHSFGKSREKESIESRWQRIYYFKAPSSALKWSNVLAKLPNTDGVIDSGQNQNIFRATRF